MTWETLTYPIWQTFKLSQVLNFLAWGHLVIHIIYPFSDLKSLQNKQNKTFGKSWQQVYPPSVKLLLLCPIVWITTTSIGVYFLLKTVIKKNKQKKKPTFFHWWDLCRFWVVTRKVDGGQQKVVTNKSLDIGYPLLESRKGQATIDTINTLYWCEGSLLRLEETLFN